MEINFIANDIVYEVTEDNSYLVGFADDKNEPKEYVIVERALEFDEQDIKLGMDSYYFEYSDQSNSGYGLCSKVVIRQNEIVFSVKHKYEDDITSITVSYKDNAIEDINAFISSNKELTCLLALLRPVARFALVSHSSGFTSNLVLN